MTFKVKRKFGRRIRARRKEKGMGSKRALQKGKGVLKRTLLPFCYFRPKSLSAPQPSLLILLALFLNKSQTMPCSKLETREEKLNETISLLLNSLLANYMVPYKVHGLMVLYWGLGWGGLSGGRAFLLHIRKRLSLITPNLGPQLPCFLRLCQGLGTQ